MLLLLLLWIFPFEVNAQDDYYFRDYEWEYDGRTWTWSLSIPKYLYEEHQSVPVFNRLRDGPGGYGFLTTTNDYYMVSVAEKLQEAADGEGYEPFDSARSTTAILIVFPL